MSQIISLDAYRDTRPFFDLDSAFNRPLFQIALELNVILHSCTKDTGRGLTPLHRVHRKTPITNVSQQGR